MQFQFRRAGTQSLFHIRLFLRPAYPLSLSVKRVVKPDKSKEKDLKWKIY